MYFIRLNTDLIPWIQIRIPPILINELIIYSLISASVFVLFWILRNFYPINKVLHNFINKFAKIWIYWSLFCFWIAYLGQWFLFVWWISRLIIIWTVIISWILIFITDIILIPLLYMKDEKVFFIYDNQNNFKKFLKLNKQFEDISYKSVLVDDFDLRKLRWYNQIILIWNLKKDKLQYIFDSIRGKNIEFYHFVDSLFLEDVIYNSSFLYWLKLLKYDATTLNEWNLVLKRIFDIVVSIVALITFFPIMIIIWIIIKLDSKWPIIYKSKRVGQWWKLFEFYKFRTMIPNADKLKSKLIKKNERNWPLFKIKDDPRITKVWKFLRKTSLDELPQLVNVLKWDMSLVGPRPHLPNEVKEYENWQKRLLTIKPWITWYSQIKWRHSLSFEQEAIYDLQYIQNWNLFLDIYIIIMTIKVVFKWW